MTEQKTYKFKPSPVKTDGEMWIDFYTAALTGSLVNSAIGLVPAALAKNCGIIADAVLSEVLERRRQTPSPDSLIP